MVTRTFISDFIQENRKQIFSKIQGHKVNWYVCVCFLNQKMNTFTNVNNWLYHTWLMRDSPFLRHISATTWATNTRQRRGNSTSTSTWKSSWNRVRSISLFLRRLGCVSQLWQYTFFSILISKIKGLELHD